MAQPLAGDLLDERLASAGRQDRALLAAFSVAGWPTVPDSVDMLAGLGEHAAILEVGLPCTDPFLDGPVIRRADREALRNGFRTDDLFWAVSRLRERTTASITVMSYWEPIQAYGPGRFAARLADAGAAAVLLPDLKAGQADVWSSVARRHGLRTALVVGPSCTPGRDTWTRRAASGFLYTPGASAPSGHRGGLDRGLAQRIRNLRSVSGLPVAVGIGITDPGRAAEVSRVADCIAVGTAFMRLAQEQPGPAGRRAAAALAGTFAASLRGATRCLTSAPPR